ncbi:MAG: zinc-dependent alcohol dehydrogenase family protein [Novosphingobium sp.]|nr:zinc-dependent alcohol dehydrogenase family protein [Novosphingobium sp.]MCP5402912.1 zinc-dependent alcohol dehydrogenase family protein [Novosphingobium sp.]
MIAMVCDGSGKGLREERRDIPAPGAGELLVEVLACGVCRTDLHVVDGDIPANYPVVPGHEIVGKVVAQGEGVTGFSAGDRVGIPWLGKACGTCDYCREGRENLCDHPEFTGATRDGGYATHALADARFCFPLPEGLGDAEAAPLLCAGLIGWRAYRMAGQGRRLGLYGFGAAAHILAQLAIDQGREVYAFTRADDAASRDFALSLGCRWAGGSDELPPEELDAAILFAPVGALVPAALKAVRKGGRVVCAGIHMSDIPSFPYADLWGEREIVSVANLTREDGTSFLTPEVAGKVKSHVTPFALADANEALRQLREGEFDGAAVLVP